jgi:hypothetical protein
VSWPTRWLARLPGVRRRARKRAQAAARGMSWTDAQRFVPQQAAPVGDRSTVELFFRDGTRVRLPAAEAETFRRIADTLAGS